MDLGIKTSTLKPVGQVVIPDKYYRRILTGIKLWDDFLGGGLLPGAVITTAARWGLGKSTLWTQILEAYRLAGEKVAYIGGEESEPQMAFRCNRLSIDELPVVNMTDLDDIIALIDEHELSVVVIDSFMSIKVKGSKMSSREMQKHVVERLIKRAQLEGKECAIVLLMHVTKAGILKGDTIVPHSVDVNIEMRSGLKELGNKEYVIIEISQKNRFGPLGEIITKHLRAGFIFDEVDQEIAIDVNATKVSKRTKNKQDEMDKILSLDDSHAITPGRVMEALKVDYAHAYGRLSELTKNNKLVKYGKGQDAVFKINRDAVEASSESEEDDEE